MSQEVTAPWTTNTNNMQKPAHCPAETNLSEIMSEQLVESLQVVEGLGIDAEMLPQPSEIDFCSQADQSYPECNDDEELARILQTQFDREHNEWLRKKEAQLNKNNKVTVSFDRYLANRDVHEDDWSSDDSEDDDVKEYRNNKLDERRPPNFGCSGVVKQGTTYTTKHDKILSGRANASRVMNFPPEFHTGDGVGMDMQLPNHVYNKLKNHSMNETKRLHRLHEKKEQSTAELAVDSNTRILLFKMVNSGLLDSISGSISTGKEANVFHAYGGGIDGRDVPSECAIKVYKTSLAEFKNRKEYVDSDYRFNNPRKVLKVWAEKEMLNLNRMRKGNILCPHVVKLRKHILVMSFIGEDAKPAPKLKDVELNEDMLNYASKQILDAMARMFNECRLVHSDLSEFNVLWWKNNAYLIDVSQAVDTSHPKALWYLARDCQNISQFFSKRGLDSMMSPLEMFTCITGIDLTCETDDDFLTKVEEFSNEQPDMLGIICDKKRPADVELRNADEDRE